MINRILGLAFIACPLITFTQDFLPALNDNYMGINQAFLQPASIVDSRFRVDFNVGGFSNDIYNTSMRFRSKWLLDPTSILTNEDWWDEYTYLASPKKKDASVFMAQSATGPSFLANFSEKHSIGFTSRVRSILNIDGMDEPLFRLIYSNYQESDYYNKWYFDNTMRATQHVFGDYGLTYARIIPIDSSNVHFLKAGITLKLLQGIASSYLQADDFYYYFNGEAYPDSKNISWNSPYVHAGVSDNWGDLNEYGNYTFSMNYQLTAKPSVGMDLGVVYEFRKDMIKDGVDRSGRPDKNKYFVKVGLSVLDIGRLKYTKDYYSSDMVVAFTPDYKNRYDIGDNSIPENTYWQDANELSFSFRDYPDFSYAMYQRAENGQGVQIAAGNKENFTVRLPSAISLQADVNLFKEGLYVNLTTYHGLNQGQSNVPNSHYISTYSITPRYENKWYSVAVPVVVNQYGKLDVGLGVRAGVVYFGVNNLFSNIFSDPYGIHAYVGVKVPIYHKGPQPLPPPETTEQSTPPVAAAASNCNCCCNPIIIVCGGGLVILPDSLIDLTQWFNQDTLNTIDSNIYNQEPFRPPIIIASCIPLSIATPGLSIPGPSGPPSALAPVGQGAPATEQPGIAPPSFTTGGGQSLPPSKIEFETAKSAVTVADQALLDLYAGFLLEDPEKTVRIAGHTDNVGSDESNLELSRRRAEASARYLEEKGVRPEQIITEWYGESQPIDVNTTPLGQQRNRRVEIELLE